VTIHGSQAPTLPMHGVAPLRGSSDIYVMTRSAETRSIGVKMSLYRGTAAHVIPGPIARYALFLIGVMASRKPRKSHESG